MKKTFIIVTCSAIALFLAVGVIYSNINENKTIETNKSILENKENTVGLTKEEPVELSATSIEEVNFKDIFKETKVKTINGLLEDGRAWSERTISNEGEIIGTTSAYNGKPKEMLIYNINNDEMDFIYTFEGKWGSCFEQINENYVAWVEAIDQYGERHFRVVLYDRNSKKHTILYEILNASYNIPYPQVALGDDFVLWSQYDDKDNKHLIMKYDIKTSSKEIFKEDATKPAVGEGVIAWLAPENDLKLNSSVYVLDTITQKVKRITEGNNPTYLAVDGKDIAFSGFLEVNDSKNTNCFLSLYENDKIKNIKTIKENQYSDYFEFPDMSKKYIGWRGADKLRVYVREKNKIAILTETDANYSEVHVSDFHIMWHSPVIVDINERKQDAIKRGVYLSNIYVISSKVKSE